VLYPASASATQREWHHDDEPNEYLFSVNTHTSPTMAVDSGEEFTVEVRGAFDDVEDINAVPTPFTPACDGHPLAPIAGPIVVRGAKPGDVVAIDLIELTPFGSGKSAILRDFGVLRREFPEPVALSSPVRDGRAWFAAVFRYRSTRTLGTISTMPPEGYKPSYAGAYGGDFDQKDAWQGSQDTRMASSRFCKFLALNRGKDGQPTIVEPKLGNYSAIVSGRSFLTARAHQPVVARLFAAPGV
jgi:hypothetical protein